MDTAIRLTRLPSGHDGYVAGCSRRSCLTSTSLKLILEVLTIQANFFARTTAGEGRENLPDADSVEGDLYGHARLCSIIDWGQVDQNPSADWTVDSAECIAAPRIVLGDLPGESP